MIQSNDCCSGPSWQKQIDPDLIGGLPRRLQPSIDIEPHPMERHEIRALAVFRSNGNGGDCVYLEARLSFVLLIQLPNSDLKVHRRSSWG